MCTGLRCNFQIEGYTESRFGFDVASEEFRQAVAAIRQLPDVKLGGLHCHYADRELRSFRERTLRIVEVARQVFQDPPEFISVGGGFFGHLPESLRRSTPVRSCADYAEVVGPRRRRLWEYARQPRALR